MIELPPKLCCNGLCPMAGWCLRYTCVAKGQRVQIEVPKGKDRCEDFVPNAAQWIRQNENRAHHHGSSFSAIHQQNRSDAW